MSSHRFSISLLLIVSLLIVSSDISFVVSAQPSPISFVLLSRFGGRTAGDNHGLSLAFAGDVDGDGSTDILVGAPSASPGGRLGAGSVFLYSGRTSSLLHQFNGTNAGDDFGISVASAGDLNSDTVTDILIGADSADPASGNNAGSVFLYSGRDFSPIGQLNGEAADDLFGSSLASIGDLNGDTRPEFAVGAIGSDPDAQRLNAGRVYIYSGDLSLIRKLDGEATQDSFGVSVAPAGDVNRDGYGDLLVGADLANPAGLVNAGSAYLFSGRDFSRLNRLDGEAAGDFFGSSVSGALDVNRDGTVDILVGAPAADPAGRIDAGSVYVFSGATYALLNRFDGEAQGDDLGWSVARAGDANLDGFSDIIAGADLADPAGKTDAGKAYLYSGRNYAVLGRVEGEADGDNFGSSVAGGADANGDGFLDAVIGAPFNSPGGRLEAGSAYLYKLANSPVASFTYTPSTPTVGQPVSFDGRASVDPDGTIVSYAWNFGDGTTGTGATASHLYTSSGSFTITLTVADNSGSAGTATLTITVNELPAARFVFTPSGGKAGQPINFDARTSADPDGTITAYSWSFGDGGSATGPVTSHTYTTAATYSVTLTVTDDRGGTGSANQEVVVGRAAAAGLVGAIPADYLFYGLIAAIAALVLMVVLYTRKLRPPAKTRPPQ